MPNQPYDEPRNVKPGLRDGAPGRGASSAGDHPAGAEAGMPIGSGIEAQGALASGGSREDNAERVRAASREASKVARRRIGQGGG